MNTADRSIAQIDTALRRRFVFEEMMPKPELLKDIVIENTEINVQKILEAINERIEYIYDREHTIGHSYFMNLLKKGCNTKEKLDEIFRVNIIPLLAEYFYGDWGDIKTVLKDDNNYFITEKREPTYIIKNNRKKDIVYLVNEPFKDGGYENIYLLIDKKN
jgi:5-methylcytosine-specific restriction protein B